MSENKTSPIDRMGDKRHTLTKEDRIKGANAVNAQRAKRKTLAQELLDLLAEGDTQKSITVAMLKQAMDGNTKAYELIRDTIGEKNAEKIENTIEIVTDSSMAEWSK